MNLLREVVAELERHHLPFALIGAAALAVHGVSRSTLDLDLFTTDDRVLEATRWSALRGAGTQVDVRRADLDDPLAGVVRFDTRDERTVDLIVGRLAWQQGVLARAEPAVIAGVSLPIARAADLVLLKLRSRRCTGRLGHPPAPRRRVAGGSRRRGGRPTRRPR